MYHNCIFCSADLKANDALERFPVGRSIAFDGEKGRLWAICPKCARWNLAPIEERWEAIEDAERLFRDTRLRVQAENIGLTKLRDGTRLIRIGDALAGELAAWRYGREMQRRRLRRWMGAALEPVVALSLNMVGMGPIVLRYQEVRKHRRADHVVHRITAADSPTGLPLTLRLRDLTFVSTAWDTERGLELQAKQTREMWAGSSPLVFRGPVASAVLGKAMVHLNSSGAPKRAVEWALGEISEAGGPEPFLRLAMAGGWSLSVPGLEYEGRFSRSGLQVLARARELSVPRPAPMVDHGLGVLAAEMALHHETERRALEGELAGLEAMWREAEEIASIADRLPDDLPAGEPPRLR